MWRLRSVRRLRLPSATILDYSMAFDEVDERGDECLPSLEALSLGFGLRRHWQGRSGLPIWQVGCRTLHIFLRTVVQARPAEHPLALLRVLIVCDQSFTGSASKEAQVLQLSMHWRAAHKLRAVGSRQG